MIDKAGYKGLDFGISLDYLFIKNNPRAKTKRKLKKLSHRQARARFKQKGL